MKQFEPDIGASVNKIYEKYKDVFNTANTTPEKIAEYIRETLKWKIKTFNPKKRKGTDLEIEIRNYCRQQIALLARDKLKQAYRVYNKSVKTESLESKIKESKTGKLTLMGTVAAKQQQAANPEKVIMVIETFVKKAKLDPEEKAVVYGKAAGLTQLEIEKMIGFSSQTTKTIINSIRKKAVEAGLKPVINPKTRA